MAQCDCVAESSDDLMFLKVCCGVGTYFASNSNPTLHRVTAKALAVDSLVLMSTFSVTSKGL